MVMLAAKTPLTTGLAPMKDTKLGTIYLPCFPDGQCQPGDADFY